MRLASTFLPLLLVAALPGLSACEGTGGAGGSGAGGSGGGSAGSGGSAGGSGGTAGEGGSGGTAGQGGSGGTAGEGGSGGSGSGGAGGSGGSGGSGGTAPTPCAFETASDPDAPRLVLVGQPYDADGAPGTTLRALLLDPDGTLRDLGTRLDVGTRVSRIAFAPSGELALVLGEDGALVSVGTSDPASLSVIDVVQLPSADFEDLVLRDGGTTAFAVGLNVAESAGISVVRVGCDGGLTVDEPAFFPLRLAESLVLLPDDRAIVLGGQTVFEPIVDEDLRLLSWSGAGFLELAAFDVYTDMISTGRMALSPQADLLLVPNGSPFSNEGSTLAVVAVEGDVLREVDRLTGLDDASEVIFSPDGSTALLSLVEPGRLVVLSRQGATVAEVERLRGVGLPEQLALVARGRNAGHVLVPSIDANGGPNIAQLAFRGPGVVEYLGQVELGAGLEHIPGAIGLLP